jgi:hypothetical protein
MDLDTHGHEENKKRLVLRLPLWNALFLPSLETFGEGKQNGNLII